jgi:hypothetical protein
VLVVVPLGTAGIPVTEVIVIEQAITYPGSHTSRNDPRRDGH